MHNETEQSPRIADRTPPNPSAPEHHGASGGFDPTDAQTAGLAKTQTDAIDEWVTLAEIVRPQGRKGELLAEILTDFPERFSERRRVFLRPTAAASTPREATVEQHWLHGGRIVLKLAGVDTIEQAEALRGTAVVIPRSERAPLEEGAVYIADLAGCAFYDRATDRVVGTIVGVDRESANLPLIVVQPPGRRGEVLIPFANAYEPRIDFDARRMEMTLPEGLLTLDAPLSAGEREELAAATPNGTAPGAARGSSRRRKPA